MTDIFIGNTSLEKTATTLTGTYVQMMGETYYRIAHYDQMPPFFMSLVSGTNHWLFIASTGGLTAGRINADSALFPYETEDKITAHSDLTGSKTIIRVTREHTHLWEPFSNRYAGIYNSEHYLYKNVPGNKLIFEEVNHDLGLTFRIVWRTGDRFGFIRTAWLTNDAETDCQITLLDGLQNILPYGANTGLQTNMSSLLNAYKRNELEPKTGLGIFSLSATISDRAEPSESLKATAVWQTGLNADTHLLSGKQVDQFRHGNLLISEHDICGKAGAYFVSSTFAMLAGEEKRWHLVADVNQTATAVTHLTQFLQQDTASIEQALEADIDQNTAVLLGYVAAADGLQYSAQKTTSAHHFANVLFNIMRGGIFADGYQIERNDLRKFMHVRNREVYKIHADWFAALPEQTDIRDLYAQARVTGDINLIRLCYEYLPLTFSRRHGDPSRPWNRFSINLKQEDGSPRLNYQGNWRDIFQNWEPLALAYPDYVEGLIAKFLNATTADGYNPYRVTRDGIEWEVLEPDNPWSNIGYWSDHQIIYLQKLLEIAAQVHPEALTRLGNQPIFVYADVPYRLRSYKEMLADWAHTIDFDEERNEATETAVSQLGTDGRLCHDDNGNIIHVTMTEKLLTLLLAKLANLVPEGGIWMNTQRPEWNDANNALVGKGLSVVTTAYLRRFIAFWLAQLGNGQETFAINMALSTFFIQLKTIFDGHQSSLETGFTEKARRDFMDDLGTAVTAYRQEIYQNGIPNTQTELQAEDLRAFLALAQRYIEHTLHANRREDGLYHTYNILSLGKGQAGVENLYLMLEGQVAILSSGLLSADEGLAMLQSLHHSALYRADQHSYMLYPNRRLPTFREKNNIPAERVADSKLTAALVAAKDVRLIARDAADVYHFNGKFHNARDVVAILDQLAQEPAYTEMAIAEREAILELFEETFNHRAFTGRSGTFFAYEGLGSIYWHMVSKLLLAAQEIYQLAVREGAASATTEALAKAYYDIRAGIGFNKSPDVYGAFPTDPYSHTPIGSGARQPGMTGQVKEEILTRWGELGISVQDGSLQFAPTLLRADEFSVAPDSFTYLDMDGQEQTISLPANSLAFTFCQMPIVYTLGETTEIEVVFAGGGGTVIGNGRLGQTISQHIFDRDGQVCLLRVTLDC
ncbi:hypothetical protein [Candidatus Leptofilum sp.]|uniref:hypothetical protein n=1 Tax=Candidatus Leptofilum sp. TaxID=3241576 RepID=UPI003B5C9817